MEKRRENVCSGEVDMHVPKVGIAWSLLALLVNGCASSPAPHGWLPTATAAPRNAFGAWISVQTREGRNNQGIEGELIAVGDDSVFVLTLGGLMGLPRTAIRNATVATFDLSAGPLAGWAFFGTLATISNGVYLVFTAPAWILTGTFGASTASRAPLIHYPGKSWDEIGKHARFPVGLPVGLDRATLRGK